MAANASHIDPPKIDRQTTTPFLLKLFYKSGSWHRLEDFSPNSPLPSHVQIYTWPSCTLRELTHLLTSALPSLLPDPSIGTRIAFRLVYPDTRASSTDPSRPGRYLSKELGSVVIGTTAAAAENGEDARSPAANGGTGALGSLEGDADKTLQDARFVIGDYVSCAVLPPLADGAVAPPPPMMMGASRGSYGGGPPPRSMGQGFGRGRPPRGNGFAGDFPPTARGGGVPHGEWRRGERIPERSYGGGGGGGGEYGGGGGSGGGNRGRGRGRGW